MLIGSGIEILKSSTGDLQEAATSSSPGFTGEHVTVIGVLGAVLLLMIARKRGWGPDVE